LRQFGSSAIALRKPERGLIHHSDRGSQFCSNQYQMLLEKHVIRPSISGKGNSCDNAAVVSFFKPSRPSLPGA